MRPWIIPDSEARLGSRILRLTAEGHFSTALRFYEREQLFLVSASTHHAAFVAAREVNATEERLITISEAAEQCVDYDAAELNFARGWALYYAEVERDFSVAEEMIREVIRSRQDDEGQDLSQLPVDELARCKIMLLSGEPDNIWSAWSRLAGLLEESLEEPTMLDIEWWFFTASLVADLDAIARATATASLMGEDRRPERQRAWRVASKLPWWLGPPIARFFVKRKLGL